LIIRKNNEITVGYPYFIVDNRKNKWIVRKSHSRQK